MAFKELAYTTKQQLEFATRQSFRHSHIYELLAASFGFNTRASLDAAHIMAVTERPQEPVASSLATLHRRLVELGYEAVADTAGAALLSMIADQRLGVTSVESVIDVLQQDHWACREEWYEVDEYEDEAPGSESVGNPSPSLAPAKIALLIDGLNGAASRGSAAAHYALALIYRGDDLSEEESSSYWYSLMEQGRDLHGVQLEWATVYKTHLLNTEREALHLAEAARLGWADARLDIALEKAQRAEHQGDRGQAEHWYKEAAALGHVEAMRALAWLAEQSRDADSARHWNHQAALHGDVDAMRDLIDEDDHGNLFESWVWVYLAERLGTDLRESTLRAYHDGGMYSGQEYDDDQGGPLYVDGNEGVQLESLNALDGARAKEAARELFRQISSL
ncbi:hypothetical protein [Stutzerimonas zhaodongensis]|uniref:Sel1 repeat family protein n=1 Tax=Stutzerimonas zhaodongensis TaxID=1176257 RepID=A0A365PQK3_9GAMM|nr:hypothetical protein [Stutzerimonas zhaodongensis]QWV17867.1 hypothetical protein KQ248_03995 [Stutzerimonas zhaodongensis]RBA52687.1 hypothetical protein DQ403_20585 [Stutzerimonas zhaodongensis]